MKKFSFNLDGVLNYRQQVLDGLQGEYARAMRRVQEQQTRLDKLQQQYRQLNIQFHEEAAAGITAADAMGYENGLRVLEQKIASETQVLKTLQQKAEEKRQQMLQAHLDATVLERLKEKKKEAYQKELQKSDEQFIDELVSATRVIEGSSSI